MKIHQLVYFLETAKHEHIGKAAKILAISPSAISHSIAGLEEMLGRQLFSKHGKNIHLTNHGKLLYEKVSRLLGELDAIREQISSDQVELQGTYKLAASHLLCPRLLVPAWAKLQESNPKLIGEIYTLRSAHVLAGVSSGEFDFGVCFSPQSSPLIQARTIYEGQLVIAVQKKHPLKKLNRTEAIKRISGFPACLPKSFQGIDNCESHPVFDKFGIVPTADTIFDSYEVALEKIQNSNGWGLLPDWIVSLGNLESIVPEGWNAPVSISAIWPRNRILTRVLDQTILNMAEILEKRIKSKK